MSWSAPRCGIYAITNTANGHQYIGSALNIERRWIRHRYELNKGAHHSGHLQRAWQKYGPDAFTFTVIEEVTGSALLDAREQHWLDALHPAYNVNRHARSRRGYTWPEVVRKKIGAGNKGKVVSEESRHKLSETRKAMGFVPWNKGKKMTKEYGDNLRRAFVGRKNPPLSEAHKAAIGAAQKGRIYSEETLAHMRAGQRRRWARVRAQIAAAETPQQQTLW